MTQQDAARRRETERTLLQFEGLIAETARQVMTAGVELEFDDICQLLREKAWKAIERYDAARTPQGMTLRRWVFGCLYNLRKDIAKRPRRFNSSIEELRSGDRPLALADWFDSRYLSVDAESVFFEVEDEEVVLPSTLSPIERHVVGLRLRGRLLVEIDRETGLSRAQRERVMDSIREKLADWAPTPHAGPRPPLPAVNYSQALARVS